MPTNGIVLKTIKFVEHVCSDEYVRNLFNSIEIYIEIFHDYKEGLKGLRILPYNHLSILT
ncbi:MAG: hypothetical protein QXZ41_06945 [Ignisphaera sp.]